MDKIKHKIPDNLKLRVHYNAKGAVQGIYLEDTPLGTQQAYGNHNLEELTKRREFSEDYFMLLLNQNTRTLAHRRFN